MFDNLFKRQKYSDDYKIYSEGFKNAKKKALAETRFVVFDTETTGFDSNEDRILSMGAISVINNTITVADSFEIYIHQEIFKSESVEIHGLLKDGNLHKVSEKEAIQYFLKYIKNDILVGHHVGFDIAMVEKMMRRNHFGRLRNKCLDTGLLFKKSKHAVYKDNLKYYSLDDLCEELKVETIDRHTATGDAMITAIVFQKIISRLNKNNTLKLKDLF